MLMLSSQLIRLALVLANSNEQLRVCLLSCQELGNNFLDIRLASGGPYFLECILNEHKLVHLFFHFLFQKN